jgi:hypothetical protein
VFGGAVLGVFLRSALPKHHMTADSNDVVKMGMGLVATLSTLVLGLLVASAKKSSCDAQNTELTQMSAKVVLLDRVLSHDGAETKEARELLRAAVAHVLDQMWSKDRISFSQLGPPSFWWRSSF